MAAFEATLRGSAALAAASLRGRSRYRLDYITSTVGPLLWVIPALLTLRFAESLGMGDAFKDATGIARSRAPLYFLAGAVYWNYVEGVWSLAMNVRGAMRSGTLEPLWCTPVPRLALVAGWSAGTLASITLQSAIAFALLAIVGGTPPVVSWVGVAALLAGSVLAAYGFAFVLIGLTLRFRDAESIVSMLGNAAPLLGGVIFPVALLPLPLRLLSYLFPFTYGADLLRSLLAGSRTLLPAHVEVLVLAAMAVVLPVLGWWGLVRLERGARARGLEGY
ncbi:MAG: ABC transporter permease [Actinomycetota bacterium]